MENQNSHVSSDRNDEYDYLSQSSADFHEVTNRRVRRKSKQRYDAWDDEPQSTFQRVLRGYCTPRLYF